MNNLLVLLFAFLITENIVFDRFLGVSPLTKITDSPIKALGCGILMSVIMAVVSAMEYIITVNLLIPKGLKYFELLAAVLLAFAVVTVIKLAADFISHGRISKAVDFRIFYVNTAVVGFALIAADECASFSEAFVYGLIAGIGLTFASFIIAGVKEKLKLASPPAAFRGLPVLLIAIGLVIMALSGLSGITF